MASRKMQEKQAGAAERIIDREIRREGNKGGFQNA